MNRQNTQTPFVNDSKPDATAFLDEFCQGNYLIAPPDRQEFEELFTSHSVRYCSFLSDATGADHRAVNIKEQFERWCAFADVINASYILCISTSPDHPLIMEEMFMVKNIIEGSRGEVSYYVKTAGTLGVQMRIDVISYK